VTTDKVDDRAHAPCEHAAGRALDHARQNPRGDLFGTARLELEHAGHEKRICADCLADYLLAVDALEDDRAAAQERAAALAQRRAERPEEFADLAEALRLRPPTTPTRRRHPDDFWN